MSTMQSISLCNPETAEFHAYNNSNLCEVIDVDRRPEKQPYVAAALLDILQVRIVYISEANAITNVCLSYILDCILCFI